MLIQEAGFLEIKQGGISGSLNWESLYIEYEHAFVIGYFIYVVCCPESFSYKRTQDPLLYSWHLCSNVTLQKDGSFLYWLK